MRLLPSPSPPSADLELTADVPSGTTPTSSVAIRPWDSTALSGYDQITMVHEQSDALLMFLLKAKRPEVYRECFDLEAERRMGDSVTAEIIAGLSDEKLAQPKQATDLVKRACGAVGVRVGQQTPIHETSTRLRRPADLLSNCTLDLERGSLTPTYSKPFDLLAAGNETGKWLPFVGTYRTLCLAPDPDFERILAEIRHSLAAA